MRNPSWLPGLAALAAWLFAPISSAQTVVGLDDGNRLHRFSAAAPGVVVASPIVTGLAAGDTLVGIDRRPATGELYGLGAAGHLYVIDPATAVAVQVATLTVPLAGDFFGVDFNPVPDRLRVVSNTGQNLRINVDTGETLVDGSINPAGPSIGASGYLNSVAGAATTALYNIDFASSSLLLQSPPNDGTVTTVGPLGVTLDAGGQAGFDVLTVGGSDFPHAVLRVAGVTGLYAVDVATGAATLLGAVGGNPALHGMAILEEAVVQPPPADATGIGLGNNTLVRFDAANPAAVQAPTAITGLQGGDSLVGIDFRPATGVLYGLAGSGRLYTINPSTGQATAGALLSVALAGSSFAVDFNPVPDRLRVVSNTGQNLRINVETGETIVDGSINPPGPAITAGGYTNSTAGATATALFDIDAAAGRLYLQNPPNDGTLADIGALGVIADADADFDILFAGGINYPLAALRVGGVTGVYAIDLTSGQAVLIGPVAGNPSLTGFAVSPTRIGGGGTQPGPAAPVPLNSPVALAILGLLVLLLAAGNSRRRQRR